MPAWPLSGAVQDAGEFVVVKLFPDPYYADEIMQPDITEVMNILVRLNRQSGRQETVCPVRPFKRRWEAMRLWL